MQNPAEVLRDCFAFLGVDEDFEHLQVDANKTSMRTGGVIPRCWPS